MTIRTCLIYIVCALPNLKRHEYSLLGELSRGSPDPGVLSAGDPKLENATAANQTSQSDAGANAGASDPPSKTAATLRYVSC